MLFLLHTDWPHIRFILICGLCNWHTKLSVSGALLSVSIHGSTQIFVPDNIPPIHLRQSSMISLRLPLPLLLLIFLFSRCSPMPLLIISPKNDVSLFLTIVCNIIHSIAFSSKSLLPILTFAGLVIHKTQKQNPYSPKLF